MSTSVPSPWQQLSDSLAQRYAGSGWRFLVLLLGGVGTPLALLYLVRGMRGVFLGAGGLAASIGFLLCFAHPFPTLLVSTFIAGSGLDVYIPGPVAWGLLAIATTRALFDTLGGRPLDLGTPAFRVSVTLLLAVATSSLVMSRSMAESARVFQHIVLGFMTLVVVSAYVQRATQLRALMITLCLAFAGNVLGLLVTILRQGLLGLVMEPTGERVGIGDVNITATLACCLIPLLAHLMGRARWVGRLALLPVFLLITSSVILAASRIGWILLGLASVALLARTRRYRPLLAVGIIGLAIVLVRLPSQYWIRLVSLGQLRGIVVDRSLQLREHALEAGWQIFREHPWLGVGLGNFPSETPRYMSLGLYAHNTYLDIAATLGIFGFAAFVAWQLSGLMMVGRAMRLWRIAGRDDERALAWAIGTTLVLFYIAALTLDLGFHLLMWTFLALANGVRRCAELGAD